jgi:predicted MFS family arabinose efflux permease
MLGGLSFGSISAMFSTMALMLAGPAHGLSDSVIGMLGLAGLAGVLMANVTGRLFDRGYERVVTLSAAVLLLLGWIPLWMGPIAGIVGVIAFVVGIVAVDLAVQATHINNQNIIYRIAPHARSRINAVYMTGYFTGAAVGSTCGAVAWAYAGWNGACLAGVTLGILNALIAVYDGRFASKR